MCVFPQVLILIMFMGGGAKLALGGAQKDLAKSDPRFAYGDNALAM